VSVFLLTYGVATSVGSYFGGRLADWNAARTMVIGTAGVTLCLLALQAFGAQPVAAAACVLGIGLFGMGIAPSMQHRVVHLAGPGATLASSLPSSAVNVGIALGATTGGLAINVAGISSIAVTGAAIAALSVLIAWTAASLQAPALAAPDPAPSGAGTRPREEASWQA
jgi:DHA1 family inner membrane transport protein